MDNSHIMYHNPINQAKDDIKKTVIWLHGLGASGHDFAPIVPQLELPFAVKFIFPHANEMPVTVNGGYVMPAWYDILESHDLSRRVDVTQINESAQRITQIIQRECDRGVLPSDIILVGFSQGGAVAYHTAFGTEGLGGLLALSTYFATQNEWQQIWQNKDIPPKVDLPILIHHGLYDETVSKQFAHNAKEFLQNHGFEVQDSYYPMAHQVCDEQIKDIARWFETRLG